MGVCLPILGMQVQSHFPQGGENPLEEEMAAPPEVLPGYLLTEEPEGLQCMESQRV